MERHGILVGLGILGLAPVTAVLIVACGSTSSAPPETGILSGDESGSSGTSESSPGPSTTSTSGTPAGSSSGDSAGPPSGSSSGSGASSGFASSGASSGSASSSGAASGSSSGGSLDGGVLDAGAVGEGGGACGTRGHGPPFVDTSTQKATSFTDGTVSPFSICTTQSPNFGRNAILDGDPSIQFSWTQVGYNGTRDRRGAEACSSLNFTKEGWYGFQFYLPAPGFPTDKSEGIGQIFALGGCSSWAAMLHVTNNSLTMSHRGVCTPTGVPEEPITSNIPRNTWNPIVIHFVVSHQKAGTLEVWFGDAVCRGGAPTFRLTGIDFGFGTWMGDTLVDTPNNGIGLKFGMYNFDAANYTVGETRTIYYDNVSQLVGNPANAYSIVNPTQ